MNLYILVEAAATSAKLTTPTPIFFFAVSCPVAASSFVAEWLPLSDRSIFRPAFEDADDEDDEDGFSSACVSDNKILSSSIGLSSNDDWNLPILAGR